MQSPAARKTRALAGITARYHGPHSREALEARRNHHVQVLADHIVTVMNSVPAPTPEQVERLRALLNQR